MFLFSLLTVLYGVSLRLYSPMTAHGRADIRVCIAVNVFKLFSFSLVPLGPH